jgi:ATP-binding cassette subfamily B protein
MDPDGPWSSFEPLGEPVGPDAAPPRAQVDPRRDLGWMRRMWPLVRARRFRFVGGLAAAMVAMVAGVLIPYVTMEAIDQGLRERSRPIEHFVWALAAVALVRAALTAWYRATLYSVAYDLEGDLRSSMFGHLTRLDFAFYDRVQAGQLISRANSDIRSVQMFLTFAPLISLNLVSFVVAFGLMLSIHVGLTLVAIATLPLTYLSGSRLRNISFPMSWIVQGRQAEITTIVDEDIQGVRVVKGFAAEERELRKLAAAATRLRWANVQLNSARARWGPLTENLPRLGLAGVLLYGGVLAIDGEVSVGAIVAFNAYVVLLQAPFRFLSFILIMAQRASASAGRIFEVLDEGPTVVERPGALDLVQPRGEVVFDRVTFAYGTGQPVLRDVTLRIAPGETVAVVGRTGSGKSTLARLLARFYDVGEGSVRVDGHDVRDLTLASLRHHVGLVLDDPFLFSVSIHDNIAYGRPDATRDEVERAARAAQADGFVRELPDGYDTVVGERGYDLSGGQRQRISIARTLLAAPTVLVLDDATSAIDVHVEEQIHAGLHELHASRAPEQRPTTILIAHRLSTIALADRVVLLDEGHVVAEGTHASLLATEPRYAAVLAQVRANETAADDRVPTGPGGDATVAEAVVGE